MISKTATIAPNSNEIRRSPVLLLLLLLLLLVVVVAPLKLGKDGGASPIIPPQNQAIRKKNLKKKMYVRSANKQYQNHTIRINNINKFNSLSPIYKREIYK